MENRQQPHEERTIVMEYTTGLPTAKFADLLIRLRQAALTGTVVEGCVSCML